MTLFDHICVIDSYSPFPYTSAIRVCFGIPMIQKLAEPISVELIFDSRSNRIFPYRIRWRGRLYTITKVGLHHFYRVGRTLYHIFSVTDGNTFFRLKLNTDTLHWTLEEIADSLVN